MRLVQLNESNGSFPNVDVKELESLDSWDVQPSHWALLAEEIYKAYHSYDGFVVVMGTDTMAYTASALSFMLENLGKAVIFTGAQMMFVPEY
ncbi:Asparaginase/glutaminase [Baffinella frigidus]|nr:Asparaginase/glutaminase [Cryptophyta sp. CCMP2293]